MKGLGSEVKFIVVGVNAGDDFSFSLHACSANFRKPPSYPLFFIGSPLFLQMNSLKIVIESTQSRSSKTQELHAVHGPPKPQRPVSAGKYYRFEVYLHAEFPGGSISEWETWGEFSPDS